MRYHQTDLTTGLDWPRHQSRQTLPSRELLARVVTRARARGWNSARLAAWFGISERHFYRLLAGQRKPTYRIRRLLIAIGRISRKTIHVRV